LQAIALYRTELQCKIIRFWIG